MIGLYVQTTSQNSADTSLQARLKKSKKIEFQDPRPKYLVNITPITIDLYFKLRPQTPVAKKHKYNIN
jgi:hypothetical protein